MTITEIVLIQMFFFTVASKQKNKWKHGIPWHLHTMQKSALLKTRESHFSLVWVIEFSIISPCLGKGKVFPIILILITPFNVCMKTVNWFYISNWGKWLNIFESGWRFDSRFSYLNYLIFRQLQSVDSL